MTDLLMKLLSSIIQVLLFSAVPFLWWLIFSGRKQNFFCWIGIKPIKPEKRKNSFIFAAIACLLFAALSLLIMHLLKGVETATSEFAGLGAKGLPAALIYAFIKTSLSEEILFRGFILKRLANKIGFAAANCVQSVLFDLLHGIMFFKFVNPVIAAAIVGFTGGVALLMGYINEKKADGSIIPSWMIHGFSNAFTSIIALFSII